MGLDESRAREGARRGHPSRHGVAVALRRQTSACAHGVAPRGEAERVGVAGLGEPGGGGGGLAGRAARGVRPAASGRPAEQGKGGRAERVEREKRSLNSNSKFSHKFLLKHEKL